MERKFKVVESEEKIPINCPHCGYQWKLGTFLDVYKKVRFIPYCRKCDTIGLKHIEDKDDTPYMFIPTCEL